MIRTPPGQATKVSKLLKHFIIGFTKAKCDTLVSPNDDMIIWVVDGNIKQTMNINRNVNMYAQVVKVACNTWVVKREIKKLSPADKEYFEDMIFNQTSVEIIKEATAQEIVEANKTWWQHIKETFNKI